MNGLHSSRDGDLVGLTVQSLDSDGVVLTKKLTDDGQAAFALKNLRSFTLSAFKDVLVDAAELSSNLCVSDGLIHEF